MCACDSLLSYLGQISFTTYWSEEHSLGMCTNHVSYSL